MRINKNIDIVAQCNAEQAESNAKKNGMLIEYVAMMSDVDLPTEESEMQNNE